MTNSYTWRIALRYIFRRLVTWLNIGSIALVVWLFVVTMTVLNGFDHFLRDNIRKTNAHVEIDLPSVNGLRHWRRIGDMMKERSPHVLGWTPQVQGIALVQTQRFRHYALVRGIDLEREKQIEEKLGQVMIPDDLREPFTGWPKSELPVYSVKVGQRVREEMDITEALLTLTAQQGREGQAFKMDVEVQGFYSAGNPWFDRYLVCDYRVAQRLYGLEEEDAVTGIGLWLDDYEFALQVRDEGYLLGLGPAIIFRVAMEAPLKGQAVTAEELAEELDVELLEAKGVLQSLHRDGILRLAAGGAYKLSTNGRKKWEAYFASPEAQDAFLALLHAQDRAGPNFQGWDAEAVAAETGQSVETAGKALEWLQANGAAIQWVSMPWEDFHGNATRIVVPSDDSRLAYVDEEQLEFTGRYSFRNPLRFRVRTWREQLPEAFASLEMQNSIISILFAVFGGVIMFLILTLMVILVNDKYRDIGILRACGATRGGIRRIFLLNGAFIGALGAALGIGLAELTLLDPVLATLDFIVPGFSISELSQSLFLVDTLPKKHDPAFLILLFLTVVVVSVLFAVYPAWKAARVDPLETIRHE